MTNSCADATYPEGDSRSRRLVLVAIALSLGFPITALRSLHVRAADPAQRIARVGFVSSMSPSTPFAVRYHKAFWDRLRELGWVEGQNLAIEARWADGHLDRLPDLMTDAVRAKVDIIVTYNTPAAIAAKKATNTIPIVDAIMGDPVGLGLVANLARPGGNLTGLSQGFSEDILGKWLQFLQETVPQLSTVAVIADLDNPISREQAKRLRAIAPTRGLKVRIIDVHEPDALDRAFDQAAHVAQAVLVYADARLVMQQRHVVALAAKHRLPDMHIDRDFVQAGGLMAYGPDYTDLFERAANYVDKILRGARASDLPIEQANKFVLVVNLKTAKALRLKIPEQILVLADEVIK